MLRGTKVMIRTRLLATLAVAALVCGLARTSDAAINLGFTQGFLTGSNLQAVPRQGSGTSDGAFVGSDPAGDPRPMAFDVGFRGFYSSGTLHIGDDISIAPNSYGAEQYFLTATF